MASDNKILVAHRGASAYAPEHTPAAYELAIAQGADYIEPDLQITSDGVLIALHDEYLERTTDVREVFPDRYRLVHDGSSVLRRWAAVDFTLEEIERLDAGSWFSPEFTGETVPTFSEVIGIAHGRAGIFPETKAPGFYDEQGFDMDELVAGELEADGLHVPGGVVGTPVQLQSFSLESLRRLRHEFGLGLPSTFLIGGGDAAREWFDSRALEEIAEAATGIGPSKDALVAHPDVIEQAHDLGLTVIPYTFGGRDPDDFAEILAETRYFLEELDVDGLFTNNPDLFPR